MKESLQSRSTHISLRSYGWILFAVWTLVVAASFFWNLYQENQEIRRIARYIALTNFERDMLFRRWAAGHGGVYVPATPKTPPSPYLAHIPERDLATPSGRQLTLLNPAYMTRQIYDLAAKSGLPIGHLTSLKPLRPENRPDPWEREALQALQQGKGEVNEILETGGQPCLRLMRPFVMEPSCLPCHAGQGAQVGEMRGGISIILPMASLLNNYRHFLFSFGIGHLLLWLLGSAGIFLSIRQIEQSAREKFKAQQEAQIAATAQQTVDGMLDSVIIATAEGKIVHFNKAFRDSFGWGEEVLEKMFTKFVAQRDMFKAAAASKECLQQGYARDVECNLLSREGKEVPVLINFSLMTDASGLPERLIGVIRDITSLRQAEKALRESEERFRALFQTTGSMIFLVSPEYRILEFNDEAERVTGWQRHEVLGRNVLELLVREELWEKIKAENNRIFSGNSTRGLEFPILMRDGTERIFLWNANLFHDSEGNPLGVIVVGQDISERKRAEDALKDSERKLRFLASQILTVGDDERSRLSREIHEGLGQPLLALKLQISAISRQLPEELVQLKEECTATLSHLDDILEDLRRLSGDLSPSVLEDLGLAAALRNLCVTFSRLQDLKILVDIDDVEESLSRQAKINVYRVFQEGLSNIGKYAQADKVMLAVKKQGDTVSFMLQDYGKGFNVAETLATRHGLGLAAMEERVRILDGSFHIFSREDHGTTITFSIPISERQAEAGKVFSDQ